MTFSPKTLFAAALACAVLAAPAAHAATHTATNDHGSTGAIDVTGSFDLSAFVAQETSGGGTFQLTGAQIAFSGSSAYVGTTQTYSYSYTYGYSCGSGWSRRTCYGTRWATGYYTDDRVLDTVQLSLDADPADGSAEQTLADNTHGPVYSNGRYTTYNRAGAVAREATLADDLLADLAADWSLDYALNTTGNPFQTLGVSLTIDYEVIPATAASYAGTATVPLPAGGLLLAGAGATLAALRRRRRA
ncbi:hypothetical protein [Pseudooceanicola sp. LIPI14-2-Ac024]|uniref:hypothetical protein n=1 Tax=Pseudooceanicola sp. LIPI14-2-Ac024 TaxID=3344875 RepID=UPI0035D0C30E